MGSRQVAVVELPGSARALLAEGVSLLHPKDAVLEAMLEGWAAQQRSRLLKATTVENRGFTVRRLVGFTNEYPWRWTPADVEEWTSQLVSQGLAHSTIRNYQMAVGLFLGYVCDARYGWAEICEDRFGTHPVQVFHEWNTAVHGSEVEARPDRRPLSREELQRFFDHCDERVAALESRAGRGGWPRSGTRCCSRRSTGGGCAAGKRPCWMSPIGVPTPRSPNSARLGWCGCVTARRRGVLRPGSERC